MADDGAVRVAIRVRPLVSLERSQDCASVVAYPSDRQIQLAGAHAFTYDYLYTEESTQVQVYNTCVAPLVGSFFEGYNATILAYGQTGSGKTHTMGTASSAGKAQDDWGIVPRVIYQLFELMKQKDATHTYLLSCSFLEIHHDEIIDLLCAIPRGRADRPVPVIKEGSGDRIEVANIVKQDVKSYEEALDTLERGSRDRATGETKMNATSSRSHAIFTLTLSQKVREDEMGISNDEFITSKFHFVDLAGSERLKRTGAEGARKAEGIAINQGLLALGNVISALGDPSRRGGHVPFRDSKITRLLQDSLGGNSKTLMIASVSPADVNREETLNTLQYANRARNIRNQAIINRDPMSQKLDILRGRIKELEAELNIYRAGGVPTAEQRAEFAALSQSVASGSTAHVGSSSSSSSSSSLLAVPHHSPHGSMADFAPTVGIDEIVVKSEEWAVTNAELQKMQQRNQKLRGDVNAKNEERLKALAVKDAMRKKIEMLADTFPEVKQFLVAEKEKLDAEKAVPPEATPGAALTNSSNPGLPSLMLSPSSGQAALASPDASSQLASSPALLGHLVGEEDDPAFFSLLAAGGSDAPFNQELSVLAEKTLFIQKLTRKYLSQKDQLDAFKKKLAATARKNRQLKKAAEADEYFAEEDAAMADAGEEDDDEAEEANDSYEESITRRKNSLSTKGADADEMASPHASAASPSGVGATGGDPQLSPEDLDDLEYDSSADKADEDMESLDTLAKLKEQEHAKAHDRLADEGMEIDKEINAKELFLAQLQSEKQRTQNQQKQYMSLVEELEREKHVKEQRIAELEKLMASKPTTPTNAHGGLSQAESKELMKYRAELAKVSGELKVYRDKLKATQEAQKRQHAADELRIKQLSSEIEKAKRARVDVSRKMEESTGKYADWKSNYESKMKLMQKNQRRSELEVRTLNEQLSQQAIQLKRAREANTVLSRRVRDQDTVSSAARTAAKVATKLRKPTTKAPSVVMGNFNANASSFKQGGGGKKADVTKQKRAHTADGKSSLPSVLATQAGSDKLTRDLATFLDTETSRVKSQREIEFMRLQVDHYQAASDDASKALIEGSELDKEAQRTLEANWEASEHALETSKKALSDAEAQIRGLHDSDALEDRITTKFKTILTEPPKRILAVLLKAFVDMKLSANPTATTDGAFDPADLPASSPFSGVHHADLNSPGHFRRASQIAGPTSADQPAASAPPANSIAVGAAGEAVTSPGHFRRGSAMISQSVGLSASGAHTSSLSSSPIFKAGTRASGSLSSPVKSALHPGSHARKSSTMMSGLPTAPFTSGVHINMSFTPLQVHLAQPNGLTVVPTYTESGDEDIQHIPRPESLFAEEDCLVGSGTGSPTSPSSSRAAGGQAIGASSSASTRVLHNNFTGGGGGDDDLEVDDLSASRKAGSATDRQLGPAQVKRVFDRLTDPSHFTGTSKTLATLQAQGGRPTRTSSESNKAPLPTKRATGPLSGANQLLASSGLASARGSLASTDRSPSPSWTGDELASAHPTANASAAASRVPFYERLSDPKSYTGAQRAKFADTQRAVAARASREPLVSKEKEREDGFVGIGRTLSHRDTSHARLPFDHLQRPESGDTQAMAEFMQSAGPEDKVMHVRARSLLTGDESTAPGSGRLSSAALADGKENVALHEQALSPDQADQSKVASMLDLTSPHGGTLHRRPSPRTASSDGMSDDDNFSVPIMHEAEEEN